MKSCREPHTRLIGVRCGQPRPCPYHEKKEKPIEGRRDEELNLLANFIVNEMHANPRDGETAVTCSIRIMEDQKEDIIQYNEDLKKLKRLLTPPV